MFLELEMKKRKLSALPFLFIGKVESWQGDVQVSRQGGKLEGQQSGDITSWLTHSRRESIRCEGVSKTPWRLHPPEAMIGRLSGSHLTPSSLSVQIAFRYG